MATRVGINGFGRIGRNFFRAAVARGADIEIVAANDLGDVATMAHLLKYDSNLGPLDGDVEVGDGTIRAAGKEFKLLSEREPGGIGWGDLGVDVVLESTGFFTKREGAQKHLDAGARKVLISAPATDPDITIVLGVNDDRYDPDSHHIVSNASCTTNCIAPMAKVLHDAYRIERGFMTTIHAYTNDQRILDLPHEDLRRARAAAINLIPTSTGAARAIGLVLPELKGIVDGVAVRAPIPTGSLTDFVVHLGQDVTAEQVNDTYRAAAINLIPTSTGAARAIGLVLPELKGIVDGVAVRAPIPTGSLTDFVVHLGQDVTAEQVNDTFRTAAEGPLEGILQYSTDPLVSTDINESPYSCIFDSELTMAYGGPMAKVFGWYDNEWGYSCRLVDLVTRL